MDELWAGEPPDGSPTTLRSYVSRLRASLGGSVAIHSGDGGYTIDVDPGAIDAVRFEALLRQGEAALARRAAAHAADRLAEALELWRGDAYGDVGGEGVLRGDALRLEELRLRAVELRLDARLALGEAPELVEELESHVREHPFRESLWGRLMLACYRSGRQADALEAFRQVRKLLGEQLGVEPGDELRALHAAILRHEVPEVVPPEGRHNLPEPISSFVGRTAEVDAVAGLLAEARLVTLTGLGGVGKTRLALEAARRMMAAYPDGVWLVDLATLTNGALLAGHVASALELREHSGSNTAEQLGRRLRDRDLVVVLDNCEHLRDAVARMVAVLLASAPHLRVLATSREPLGVAGEATYPVPPMDLPADASSADAVRGSDAVELFLRRALAARPSLARDDASIVIVGHICQALDGLPLAIELAAARVNAMSPREIHARLGDRFGLLVSGRPTAPQRHQTLRMAMDWSFELLTDDERAFFAQLSVFAGGLDLAAAATVCVRGDEPRTLDLVSRLVDVSLIVAREGRDGMRYELLETVRQYARSQLLATGAAETTRSAHARYYLALVESANLAVDDPGRGPQKPDLIEPEEGNVRVALEWAYEHDVELGLRLAVGLEHFWVTRDPSEGDRWLGALLHRAAAGDRITVARALRDHGSMAHVLGEFDAAEQRYLASRTLFEAERHERGVAEMTFRLGIIARKRGDLAAARQDGDSSLATFRRLGDRAGEVQVLTHLALLAFAEGRHDEGLEILGQSMAMTEEVPWTWWQVQNHGIAARWLLEAGRVDEGERHARETLRLSLAIGDRSDLVRGLILVAWAAAARGDRERASVLWTAADAEAAGVPIAAWGAGWAALAPTIADRVDPSPTMRLADAVSFALAEPQPG